MDLISPTQALDGLEGLLHEMATTNVTYRLKPEVHRQWCRKVELYFNSLKAHRAALEEAEALAAVTEKPKKTQKVR